MKIVQNTPDLFIAEAKSRVWQAGFAICLTFTIAGIAIGLGVNNSKILLTSFIAGGLSVFASALLAFHVVRLTLDRNMGTVELAQTGMRRTHKTKFQLNAMIEANTWENLNMRYLIHQAYHGARPPPKLALIFATADPPHIHIVPGWSEGESAMVAVANTINAWLSLDVDSDPLQA